MKIFTPIAASLVLVSAAVQGELIAQKDHETDLRQHIRRIVREELKRALAEIHDSKDRAAAHKKAVALKKAIALKKRASAKKAPVRLKTRPIPMAPNVAGALDRARKALDEARRALAEAEHALQRGHGDFQVPKVHVPKVQIPRIQVRELQVPKFNLQLIGPESETRTFVLDGKKGVYGITYEVEGAPTKAKKKGRQRDPQPKRRKKQKESRTEKNKRRKARDKVRSGRIV